MFWVCILRMLTEETWTQVQGACFWTHLGDGALCGLSETCLQVRPSVLAAVVRLSLPVWLVVLGGLGFSSTPVIVVSGCHGEQPGVKHRRVDGHGPEEAQRRVVLPLPGGPELRTRALRDLRGSGAVARQAQQRLRTQRALHGFIHLGVHLHPALLGAGPPQQRGGQSSGADPGQAGPAELQVVQAMRGHEAAVPLPPGAAPGRRNAARGPAVAEGWQRGEEALHPGAVKPAHVSSCKHLNCCCSADWLIKNRRVQDSIRLLCRKVWNIRLERPLQLRCTRAPS